MSKKEVQTGTIIHGTYRPEDLWDAFSPYLGDFANEKWFQKAEKLTEYICENFLTMSYAAETAYTRELDEIINDHVFPLMEDLAPSGYYFGTHPGNSSDFGFWSKGLLGVVSW